ncbi:NAD(P)H-dependent oxidoreductase [Novispirillum sp. DQ9]|uniref:NAD(P)H-dependent oxidoreductase n=1 Tax=Novispirillum sp. DQ9 TaxID=3398612 RepID=UPI003C7A4DD1
MSLHALLSARAAAGRPVRVALIGAGKFGTMFLAQARHSRGLHVVGVADRDADRARLALAQAGWSAEAAAARGAAQALKDGSTWVSDDAAALIAAPGIEVVIEATGHPSAALAHALACLEAGRHLVMVTVEADVLAGPLLARRFHDAGLVYSMAYGDQPALIAELVDWARACGFGVVAAGKGTKYLPSYHASTPESVWAHYGLSPAEAEQGGMNARMFNSFLDGTKSAIEMAAVANACGLDVPAAGLEFPPVGAARLAEDLRPRADGGLLERAGMVEVVSSLNRDGTPVRDDLRWGVYVVVEAPSAYTARCFREYGLTTDSSGRYAALWRPAHLIGLELGISVASAALRGEATGAPREFRGDAVAVAKRPLKAGEALDGEGGTTAWGRLMPAAESVRLGALPIGLAHGLALRRDIAEGAVLTRDDVALNPADPTVRLRDEMEAAFGPMAAT